MGIMYNTKTFTEFYENYDAFEEAYESVSAFNSVEITPELEKIYYLLYARYGNSPIANFDEKEKIMSEFNKRNIEIKNDGFVLSHYKNFSDTKFNQYIIMLSGNRLIYKILNRFGIKPSTIFKSTPTAIINAVECEAHRELLLQSMKNKIKTNK